MTVDVSIRQDDPLLRPLSIKHLTLRNRIMSTAHACGLERDGLPLERYQRYHEEKARGGLALTMFGGSSNVAADSPNTFRQLNVGTDAIIPHLQEFSRRVHAQGAAIMCQITHLGRRGESYLGDKLPMIGPSVVRETQHRSFPKAMDEHDIARVVEAYARAAARCKEGGLDGIEALTGAHLIGQFLSPDTNLRSDRWGGSLENRCRFGLAVMEAIRERVGDDFLIGLRIVVDEGSEGGLDFASCVRIAEIFQRQGTLDFFNAIYGRMDTLLALAVDNMPGMASPLAPWLQRAGEFKRAVDLPVFHAARITDLATARYAIGEGVLDMAAMTRAHIADPHLVAKLMRAEEDRVRPCVGATHCMSEQRPTCLHNPASGHEAVLPQVITPRTGPRRKVVVVGAGPGGLEAARVCAARGHAVVLFEAAERPGGQVLLAASASWRRDLIGVIDWRVEECDRLGVSLHTGVYAEAAEVLAEQPDWVIVATGGVPQMQWLDGHALCDSAWDVLTGQRAGVRGQRTAPFEVLVYDGTGRHTAPSACERLLMQGCRVILASIDGDLAQEMTYAERAIWKRRCYELELETHFDQRLERVVQEGNRLHATLVNEFTGTRQTLQVDQVVLEHGTQPVDDLHAALRGRSCNDGVTDLDALLAGAPQPAGEGAFQLHRLGDAIASRNIHSAVLDALRLCAPL
jgi:2,4-dienoyl-CoA reductase-like NADH-dependent reductase (Old Yellow Enzyme family)